MVGTGLGDLNYKDHFLVYEFMEAMTIAVLVSNITDTTGNALVVIV